MGFEQFIKYAEVLITLLASLGFVIEITPIKISPLKFIGKRLMSSQDESIKELKRDLTELKQDFVQDKIERIRSELLDFSNACMNHRKHTEKEFENIFKKEKEYNRLCEVHKIENGYTEDNMKYVHQIYLKCKNEGRFLEYKE